MKKTILRSLSIFLAIFFLLGAIPIGASAAEITSDFEYLVLDDGNVEITSYIGNNKNVVIPEEIDDKSVTKISDLCFKNSVIDIESITIPKTINHLGEYEDKNEFTGFCMTFINLANLKSINVDDQNISYSSVDGVLFNKDISKLIYYPRSKIAEEYVIPSTVKEVRGYAFSEVLNLRVLKFDGNLEKLDGMAISYMYNLQEVYYPNYNNRDQLYNKIITSCPKLSKVVINKEISYICENDFEASPVKLYVYTDSYGLEWAKSHDFPYVIMEEPPVEKDLVDENTGIQVSGVMDAEATLNVESVENSVENAISTFDITLVKDGNIIQPDGTITISIPSEYGDCEVFWIKDDGTKVNMNAGYVDGKYVFTTDHLSIYALVRDIVPTVPEPTATDPVPSETVPEPTETIPVPTETVPEPTETIPVPTETVPEPTETVPVPTETVPVTTVTDPITTEPTATEATTTDPVVTPDTPSNGNNGSNGSSSNTPSGNSTNTNISNGAVATGDMFGIDNSILIALILAATTAMIIASKKRKDSSK